MKSTELRIGNYYLSFGVDLKQVEQLTKDKMLIDFHPLTLTEEWVINFGFQKDIGDYFYINVENDYGGEIMFGDYNGEVCAWLQGCDQGRVGVFIKYVHQLQNLYFTLTGEELVLNVP